VLHGWLRSGNCSSARGVVAFLTEALALAPASMKIAFVRAGGGFFADELLAFKLLSLYQRQITPEKPYRQPANLSTEVFIAGAVLGLIGKQIALKLSSAWGGLAKHKPVLDAVLSWIHPALPKLDSAPITGTFAASIPSSTPPPFTL